MDFHDQISQLILGNDADVNENRCRSPRIESRMLDYDYVAKCQDLSILKDILKILISGREGRYPDLEKTVENKILSLLPEKESNTRIKEKKSATAGVGGLRLVGTKNKKTDNGNQQQESHHLLSFFSSSSCGRGNIRQIEEEPLDATTDLVQWAEQMRCKEQHECHGSSRRDGEVKNGVGGENATRFTSTSSTSSSSSFLSSSSSATMTRDMRNVPIRAKEVVKLHNGGANGNHNDNMIGNIKVNTSKNKIAAPPAVASSTKQKEEGNILLVADNKKTNPIERICKERLSNREYFQAWDKFDVEAAEEALDSSTSSNGEDDDDDDLVLLKLNSDNNNYENDANSRSNSTRKVTVIREEETYNDDGLTTFCEKLNLQSLSPEERKFMATREREKGNECYRIQQYETAIDHYSKSIVLYNENAVVYANRAMACIRYGKNLDRALDDCNRALDLDPAYTKALARRGKIYQINGRYHDALRDFADCVRKEPGNEEYEKLWMQAKEKYGPDDEDDYDEQSKKRIVIIEDDEEEDGTCSVSEEEDILEEIYTPGCMTKK